MSSLQLVAHHVTTGRQNRGCGRPKKRRIANKLRFLRKGPPKAVRSIFELPREVVVVQQNGEGLPYAVRAESGHSPCERCYP
eukprot:scaffold7676_cov258-Pinguiococcus_pyrenoidosus.AAC.4